VKATDFNMSKDLKFNPETGVTSFHDSRLVIMDAGALGLLRQNLVDLLGWQKAREILLRFGFQNGYSDFKQMQLAYQFDSETELLASGPVIHTWEGIVSAIPTQSSLIETKGIFSSRACGAIHTKQNSTSASMNSQKNRSAGPSPVMLRAGVRRFLQRR